MHASHTIVHDQRRCSRCLGMFPADESLFFPDEHAWWLCEPCSERLLGPDRMKGWRRAPQPASEDATQ
jgi:hypothetical protein